MCIKDRRSVECVHIIVVSTIKDCGSVECVHVVTQLTICCLPFLNTVLNCMGLGEKLIQAQFFIPNHYGNDDDVKVCSI